MASLVTAPWMFCCTVRELVNRCVYGGSVLSPGSKRLDVQLGNGSTGVCVCVVGLFCPQVSRDWMYS